MRKIRTFVDANVLIAAAKAKAEDAKEAFCVLGDPEREFVTNDYLWLETVPKARYNGYPEQADFFEQVFASAVAHHEASAQGIVEAKALALKYGLSGIDALHVCSAITLGAHEFITGERKRILSRVREIAVRQLGTSAE
jgi:predicted nucleic acid-binding protein